MKQITMVYNYGHGKMTICLDEFFPCTSAELKKLFKVILMDDCQSPDYLLSEIFDFCKEKKEICESNKKIYANKYADARTCRAECAERIKERKATNGLPLTKDQLQEEREQKKLYMESEREYDREFKKNSKTAERLRKNIEQIQEYSKGR